MPAQPDGLTPVLKAEALMAQYCGRAEIDKLASGEGLPAEANGGSLLIMLTFGASINRVISERKP